MLQCENALIGVEMGNLTLKFNLVNELLVSNAAPIFSAPLASIILPCVDVAFVKIRFHHKLDNLTLKSNSIKVLSVANAAPSFLAPLTPIPQYCECCICPV